LASAPLTIIDKIWNAHVILEREDGDTLLWIDRHYVHEGSNHGFGQVAARDAKVARPDLTFGIADHYVPTRNRASRGATAEIRNMIDMLEANTSRHGVPLFGLGDPRQGIVHVTMPEQGLTLPGLIIVCGDSHTSTHGALGAYAFGIGASEVAHVLMTQTLWQKRPKKMRVSVSGRLPAGVTAKDLALNVIAGLGSGGATGHAIEYAGEAVRALSIEARMTLCNLSIEAGSRLGIVAPDEQTFAFLKGRPFAPGGDMFDQAVAEWRKLASDADAAFDSEIAFDASAMAPTATWGTSPEQALPITARLPDPARIEDETKAQAVAASLDYMGLRPGTAMSDIPVDRVFIGSCTNSRIEDLRVAAAILSGRKAIVPGLVSPGSMIVKAQAEQEGLDRIFIDAGLSWEEAGCSMCVGMNGDMVDPGQRCASTSNRNFKGRQGPGARTHLVSPAMAAAAALTGRLSDVRPMLEGRKS
jgi:3-isopropylmalate/(R)-2-methylmalate dehydratase large subunit